MNDNGKIKYFIFIIPLLFIFIISKYYYSENTNTQTNTQIIKEEVNKYLNAAYALNHDIIIENKAGNLEINTTPNRKILRAAKSLSNESKNKIIKYDNKITKINKQFKSKQIKEQEINKLNIEKRQNDFTIIKINNNEDEIINELKNKKIIKIANNIINLKYNNINNSGIDNLIVDINKRMNKCPYFLDAQKELKNKSFHEYRKFVEKREKEKFEKGELND